VGCRDAAPVVSRDARREKQQHQHGSSTRAMVNHRQREAKRRYTERGLFQWNFFWMVVEQFLLFRWFKHCATSDTTIWRQHRPQMLSVVWKLIMLVKMNTHHDYSRIRCVLEYHNLMQQTPTKQKHVESETSRGRFRLTTLLVTDPNVPETRAA
jgi:hypothetical protein